eukprot:5809740-Karenia_brevis.AAC.1
MSRPELFFSHNVPQTFSTLMALNPPMYKAEPRSDSAIRLPLSMLPQRLPEMLHRNNSLAPL